MKCSSASTTSMPSIAEDRHAQQMAVAWAGLCAKAAGGEDKERIRLLANNQTVAGEADPYGKPANGLGAKLDAGKSPIYQGLIDYFPRACSAIADISRRGAIKYAWKGWETVPDGFNRYSNAMGRHLLGEAIEGLYDSGPTGLGPDVLHAAQVAWNACARLELKLRELEKVNGN